MKKKIASTVRKTTRTTSVVPPSDSFRQMLTEWIVDEEKRIQVLGCSAEVWKVLLPVDLTSGVFMAVFPATERFFSKLDEMLPWSGTDSSLASKRHEIFSRSCRAAVLHAALTASGVQPGFVLGYTAREISDRFELEKLVEPVHTRAQTKRARLKRGPKMTTLLLERAFKQVGPSFYVVLDHLQKHWEDLVAMPPHLTISRVRVSASKKTCLRYFDKRKGRMEPVSFKTVEAAITKYKKGLGPASTSLG